MDKSSFPQLLSSVTYLLLLYNGTCNSLPVGQYCANNIDKQLINVGLESKDSFQDSCCLTNEDFKLIFQSNSTDNSLRLESCSEQDNEFPLRPFERVMEFTSEWQPDDCSSNFFENVNGLRQLYLERCGIRLTLLKKLLGSQNKLENLRLKKSELRDISEENFGNQNQLLVLEISYNKIKYLTNKTFYGLRNLQRLILNNNQIKDIAPNSFSHLTNLEVLDLGYNRLKSLTERIFSNNVNLEYLYLNGNHLTYLPENIFSPLSKLTKLYIQNNLIANIPENIFRSQSRLEELNMNHNAISELPERVFEPLTNLLVLNFGDNKFSRINDSLIKNLINLTELDLSQNEILIFPNEIMNFKKLTNLDLKGNRIASVPQNVFGSSSLSLLDLDKNQIEDISLNLAEIKHDVHIKINDNKRNISSIILDTDGQTKYQIKLELTENSINCNVYQEYYDKFFLRLQNPTKYVTFILDNTECYQPEFLKGRSVRDISSKEVVQQLYGCPENCDCYLRYWDEFKVVNCSYRNLHNFPHLNLVYHDAYTSPNSIELNMTGNLLTSVTEENIPADYNNEKIISNFKLYLSNNKIKEFTWAPKSNLEVLTLDGNELDFLGSKVLESFKNISNLTLSNNPWSCDCSAALPLWNFLQNMTLNEKIQCKTGRILKEMTLEQLCPNNLLKIVLPSVLFILFLFSTLICFLIYYRELIRAWLYHKRWLLSIIAKSDLDKNKKYDVFLAYSNYDKTFVEDTLLPWLESDEIKMIVCIHVRNFMPGEIITKQCVESIHNSRRTLVVLSNNFLDSGWCLQEFRVAYQQGIEDRRNRLIAVKCGLLNEKLFTKEIKTYLKTTTYVERGDRWFWEKLEYALPHKVMDIFGIDNKEDIENSQMEKHDLLPNVINSKTENLPDVTDMSNSVIQPNVPLLKGKDDQNNLTEIINTHNAQDNSNGSPYWRITWSPSHLYVVSADVLV